MFDTHCHLNFEAFNETYTGAINDAREAGVKYFVIPATDIDLSKRAIDIANNFENVFAAIGIHPTKDLEEIDVKKAETILAELATKEDKVIAIGETGLDYYRYRSPQSVQKTFFKMHVKLAAKLDKALIVHNRHAGDDVLELLNANFSENLRGKTVIHCCEPDEKYISFAKDHGFFIGVDGDVTYDVKKQEFIKNVPLDMLVLETDSPFLIPEPLRNQKVFPNTPANIKLIAEFIADLKSVDVDKLKELTTSNSFKLFNIT